MSKDDAQLRKVAKRSASRITPTASASLIRAHRQWECGKLRSAFRLFLAAAKRGELTAQVDLGYFYDTGIGMKPNRAAAMYWYARAYRKGEASAANNMGTVYRDEGKLTRAILWLQRAIEMGQIDSNLTIAEILIEKRGRFKDALPYLRRVVKAKRGQEVSKATWDSAKSYLQRGGHSVMSVASKTARRRS